MHNSRSAHGSRVLWPLNLLSAAVLLAGFAVAAFRGSVGNAVAMAIFVALSGVLLWLGRSARLPQGVVALLMPALLLNAVGWTWNLYVGVPPFDEVAHGYSCFAATVAAGVLIYPRTPPTFREHRAVLASSVVAWGGALGGAWELFEWLLRAVSLQVAGRVGATLEDTLLDIGGVFVGALLAAPVTLRFLQPRASGPAAAEDWAETLTRTA